MTSKYFEDLEAVHTAEATMMKARNLRDETLDKKDVALANEQEAEKSCNKNSEFQEMAKTSTPPGESRSKYKYTFMGRKKSFNVGSTLGCDAKYDYLAYSCNAGPSNASLGACGRFKTRKAIETFCNGNANCKGFSFYRGRWWCTKSKAGVASRSNRNDHVYYQKKARTSVNKDV